MGFQPDVGAAVVVAKLTDLGTRYLLTDPGLFEIKKFAAYDDEIDYTLWDETHPNGSNYFGIAIESLHLLEPIKSSTWQLRYPLVRDFPRDTLRMPYIDMQQQSGTISNIDDSFEVAGRLTNITGNKLIGYISDISIADVRGGSKPLNKGLAAPNLSPPGGWNSAGKFDIAVRGENFSFNIVPKLTSETKVVEVVVEEPGSGIKESISITVDKNNTLNIG